MIFLKSILLNTNSIGNSLIFLFSLITFIIHFSISIHDLLSLISAITNSRDISLGNLHQQSIARDTSNNTGLLRSLNLLGFKQQAVQVMLAEYNADTLEKALDKLDTLNDLTNPKTNFLEILQEIHDGDSHA